MLSVEVNCLGSFFVSQEFLSDQFGFEFQGGQVESERQE